MQCLYFNSKFKSFGILFITIWIKLHREEKQPTEKEVHNFFFEKFLTVERPGKPKDRESRKAENALP